MRISTIELISAALLTTTVILSIYLNINYKKRAIITSFNVLFIGVFISVMIAIVPIEINLATKQGLGSISIVLSSITQTILIFTANVDSSYIYENIGIAYAIYLQFLLILAPLITFTFIFSLFKNTVAKFKYVLCYFKDAYIFSELNEKTITLAKDIQNLGVIVFCNASAAKESLIDEAKELKSLIFFYDINSCNFTTHSKKRLINFLILEDDASIALKIAARYNGIPNTNLYINSYSDGDNVLLSNIKNSSVKVRFINEYKLLTYKYLYNRGTHLFNNKCINIAILGLGTYGIEMFKALTWLCQIDGFKLMIDVFEKNDDTLSRLKIMFPELMDKNGIYEDGEAYYDIRIHSGIDVFKYDFSDYFKANSPCFIYVSLGNDKDNIEASILMRTMSERYSLLSNICVVVNDNEKNHTIKEAVNFKGEKYNIDAIGSFDEIYSKEVIMASELEKIALNKHLKWGCEEDFWKYNYNYNSSMATAVADKIRKELRITGDLSKMEHIRWNAYMRSEGYVYSGSRDKNSRNDIAKTHHDLVNYNLLSKVDIEKDDKMVN